MLACSQNLQELEKLWNLFQFRSTPVAQGFNHTCHLKVMHTVIRTHDDVIFYCSYCVDCCYTSEVHFKARI